MSSETRPEPGRELLRDGVVNNCYPAAPPPLADLGQGIGSARWFGAMAVLLLLVSAPFGAMYGLSKLSAPDDSLKAGLPGVPRAAGPGLQVALIPQAGAAAEVRLDGVVTLAGSGSVKDTLLSVGVRATDAEQADRLVSSAIFPDRPAAGTGLHFRFADAKAFGDRSLSRLDLRPRLETKLTIISGDGRLSLAAQTIPVDATPLRVSGRIDRNLTQSAVGAGLPREVAPQLLAALSANMPSGKAIQAGDTFDLVVNFRSAADGETRAGELLFAAIARDSLPVVEMLRWGNEGALRTIDRVGKNLASAAGWPVKGRRTSGYGMRFHPVLGYPRLHRGIDFGAPTGSPIHVVSDGVVSFAGRHGGHGNYVCVAHGRGLATCYAHLARIDVAPGASLRAGETLGTVGSTGLSTGPHLHYEVYRNGRPVDPARAGIGADSGGSSASGSDSLSAGIAVLKALNPTVADGAAARSRLADPRLR